MQKLMLLVFAPLIATGQTSVPAGMSGPVLGYVYDDGAKSIRRVTGVLGALGIEGAVPAEFAIERAYVSPGGNAAVAVAKDGGGPQLLRWTSDTVAAIGLGDGPADQVAFSPNGS